MDIETRFRKVLEYHMGSKHHPNRFAPGPGHLDWANEPDPFRRYEGAPLLRLPFLAEDPDANHFGLYQRRVPSRSLTLPAVAALLELSLGLSAWKSHQGSSWSLRINPSSGDLHPTECHLLLPPLDGTVGGVFHYDSYHLALEHRASLPHEIWKAAEEVFGQGGFLVGLSSIAWREAWKYGVRAFRYCGQDLGHAMACLSFSAALLGWRMIWLDTVSDEEVATLFGLDRCRWPEQEEEIPQSLLLVQADTSAESPRDLPPGWLPTFAGLSFGGVPNRLSAEHLRWPVIEEVMVATAKPRTSATTCRHPESGYLEGEIPGVTAAGSIRRRRSALAFDRRTHLSREHFFDMLDKTLPRAGCAPFDLVAEESCVHLFLFVHRVQGVEPGLYFLVRNAGDLEELQRECSSHFRWKRVAAAEPLPLFLLHEGKCQAEATLAGCGQEIAGDGAFSVAMVARFRSPLEASPWRYRHLHWEAGMIGQVLYLEAEAHGMRGTGMGCFFDDVTHHLLGLSGDAFQDLYHFTIGKAVDDPRLITLPPYAHLRHP
ncbi:MAG: SagB/ThcOx family dehydrogenase [Deltaproteobacteria bacterium]|nr:SagB/ThcOx family dehydrogenase [Deltaproteobacteria bacterium]